VAIVLRRAGNGSRGVSVSDFASVSRSYSPEDDRLDTAEWVKEALSAMSGPDRVDEAGLSVIEAAAPTPIAEARALSALGFSAGSDQARFNPSGGGATAHFGQATALRQIAETSRRLAAGSKGPSGSSSKGLVLDLTGPAGQHTTAIMLQAQAVQ
jgi:hypothetical protein